MTLIFYEVFMKKKYIDSSIGVKYGFLTIISENENEFICKCDCGNFIPVNKYQWSIGNYSRCGECYNGKKYEDYIGKTYGLLKIITFDKDKKAVCECQCNNTVTRTLASIFVAKKPECGKCYNGKSYASLIGYRSGILTVENIYSKKNDNENGTRRKFCFCRCDCGNHKEFPLKHIMNGNTKKCGECYNGKKYTDFIGEKYGTWEVKNILNKTQKYYATCKCVVCGNTKDISLTFLTKKENACSVCNSKNEKYKNLIGKSFKNFTLLNFINNKSDYLGELRCNDCNRIYKRHLRKLTIETLNKLGNCGYCYKGIRYEDYIGKKFGILTILDFKKKKEVHCRCECGNEVELHIDTVLNPKETCGKCYNGKPFEYYIGKTSGYLTIEKITEATNKLSKPTVICRCACTNTVELRLHDFFDGIRVSCGHCYNGKKYEDYIGKTYGYFTIQNIIRPNKSEKKRGYYINCTCKCDNSKILKRPLNTLLQKNPVLSCGCLTHKIHSLKKIKFGNLNVLNFSNHNEEGLRYICKCDCGNEIEVLESDLFTGKVTCCKNCNF